MSPASKAEVIARKTERADELEHGYRLITRPRPASDDAPGRTRELPILDPDSAALGGLAGDVVRALEPGTEADPAGMLLHFLAKFGAMVGDTAEFRIGSAHHPPALFVVLVGRSSHSRKGTTREEVDGILERVDDGWSAECEVGGFGSGEAFVEHAAEHPGSPMFVVEVEMARVFATAGWDNSTVSTVLRKAFDYQRLEHRTRKTILRAPRTAVSLVGHITADELRDPGRGLRPVEIANGFGNRVLWAFVDRRKLVPRPRVPEPSLANDLIRRIGQALTAARGTGEMTRDPEAEELWDELYARLQADETGATIVDQLTARAVAHISRLAMIYALLDQASSVSSVSSVAQHAPTSSVSSVAHRGGAIKRRHLEAAWEVWRYCRWSIQHTWLPPGTTGDPEVDRVLDVLEGGESLASRDLDRMFQGNRSSATIRARVLATGRAELVKIPTAGAPRKVLQATPLRATEQTEEARWWRSVEFKRENSDGGSPLPGKVAEAFVLPALFEESEAWALRERVEWGPDPSDDDVPAEVDE
jgi:hypothetical protein